MEKPARRLITPETVALSRSEFQPARKSKKLGGVVIESAEGIRWAYSDIPLPRERNYDFPHDLVIERVSATSAEPPVEQTGE